MRSRLIGSILACFCLASVQSAALGAEAPGALATSAVAAGPTGKTPAEVVNNAPKGSLKNPFKTTDTDRVSKGHDLFMSYSCNGCHGGTGGGGMCPPLTGDVWFFGIDDDALFRLVTLGSADLQKAGFEHLGGPSGMPMPPFGTLIKSDEELWEILTWVRTVYKGDPKKKTWE